MKREFYLCDGDSHDGKGLDGKCGVILVNDTDGRIIRGTVKKPSSAETYIDSGDGERALCTECLKIELGLEEKKS